MNVILLPSTPSPGRTESTAPSPPLWLRFVEGQIVVATIRRVTAGEVLLDVAGRLLPARLDPSRGAAPALLPGEQVRLKVAGSGPERITLRLVDRGPVPGDAPSPQPGGDLVSRLLAAGIEADDLNLTIAESFLRQSGTVRPEDVLAVRAAWQALPSGEPADVEPLVFLRANQLPAGQEPLELARHWLGGTLPVAERLEELSTLLEATVAVLRTAPAGARAPAALTRWLQSALDQIAQWRLQPDLPPDRLAEQVGALLARLGTPPEAELASLASGRAGAEERAGAEAARSLPLSTGPAPDSPRPVPEQGGQAAPPLWQRPGADGEARIEGPASVLHRLAATPAQTPSHFDLDEPALASLHRLQQHAQALATDLGAFHLANLGMPLDSAAEPFYVFPIPIRTPDGPRTAQLKVFRRPGTRTVDPANARLALLLDLPRLGEMAIQIAVAGRYLSAQILSARPETNRLVEASAGALRASLGACGYRIDTIRCDLLVAGDPSTGAGADRTAATVLPLTQLDVRV